MSALLRSRGSLNMCNRISNSIRTPTQTCFIISKNCYSTNNKTYSKNLLTKIRNSKETKKNLYSKRFNSQQASNVEKEAAELKAKVHKNFKENPFADLRMIGIFASFPMFLLLWREISEMNTIGNDTEPESKKKEILDNKNKDKKENKNKNNDNNDKQELFLDTVEIDTNFDPKTNQEITTYSETITPLDSSSNLTDSKENVSNELVADPTEETIEALAAAETANDIIEAIEAVEAEAANEAALNISNKNTTDKEANEAADKNVENLETSENEETEKPGGAFNPDTGEINWDCPCLGGMAHGPCGPEFKDAFSCFVYSDKEPKGIECVSKFQTMQNCFRAHPEVYKEQLDDDDDVSTSETSTPSTDSTSTSASASSSTSTPSTSTPTPSTSTAQSKPSTPAKH